MAMDNLKDFSIEWITLGLLFFSMVTFAILFTAANNPTALGEEARFFDDSKTSISGNLGSIESSSNNLLNTTKLTDPTASEQGSKDSVSTSYGIMGVGKGMVDSVKVFASWILGPNGSSNGTLLISVLVAMFGMISIYFITKWVRQGG